MTPEAELANGHRVTGRQLTIMVVAICTAVVLAPVGVYAAAHSKVSIVDAKHPGRNATVTASGAQLITGAVTTSASAPRTPYMQTVTSPSHLTIPAGKRLVVTSITGSVVTSAGAHVSSEIAYQLGAKVTQIWLNLPDAGAISSTEFFYGTQPISMILSGGGTLTPIATGASGQLSMIVTIYGYLVPE